MIDVLRRIPALLMSLVVAGVLTTATASAGAILNQTTPFAHDTFSTCTEELVHLQGNLHTVVHFGESGDRVHLGEDVRFTGMEGMGLLSGARYIEMDVQNTQANVTQLGPQEFTAVRTMNLTRLGEDTTFGDGDDLRMHVTAHVTVNANGIVTVDKVDAREECR